MSVSHFHVCVPLGVQATRHNSYLSAHHRTPHMPHVERLCLQLSYSQLPLEFALRAGTKPYSSRALRPPTPDQLLECLTSRPPKPATSVPHCASSPLVPTIRTASGPPPLHAPCAPVPSRVEVCASPPSGTQLLPCRSTPAPPGAPSRPAPNPLLPLDAPCAPVPSRI
jgi:hypothetical protein